MAPQTEDRTAIVTEVAKWPIDGMDSGIGGAMDTALG
jgi:hypothetical protein